MGLTMFGDESSVILKYLNKSLNFNFTFHWLRLETKLRPSKKYLKDCLQVVKDEIMEVGIS